MRNQPHSLWQVIDSTADHREEAWNLDRQVELRTWLVGLLSLCALAVILLRLYDLKARLPEAFLKSANPVTIQQEVIPAMDGRIYANDGQLLAYDHQRFAVALHYRWLEEPPDPKWLRQQARKLVNRRDWSNEAAMERARDQIHEQQRQLWQRLSGLSGVSVRELTDRRRKIQNRVERIAQSVRRRQLAREERQDEIEATQSPFAAPETWWQLIVRELTEPPRRETRDPIVIQEELDYHDLLPDVPVAIVAEIESHPQDYPGIRILLKTNRVYPHGDFAAHLIGNRTIIRDDQLQRRREQLSDKDPLAYQAGDRVGRFGVERSYDATLRGLPGVRQLTRNRRGEVISSQLQRPARSGRHLVLSIHSQLQRTAEELLDQRIPPMPSLIPPLPAGSVSETSEPTAGAVLVMNIYSGELLAAATAPRPDLTRMTAGTAEYWAQLTGDSRAPLLSRLTQVTLAPGSTFKPLTAIALCETAGLPTAPLDCQGFLDTPESHRCLIFRSTGRGHGSIGLVDALARSCNVYFFQAARTIGPQALTDWSERCGFGESTGVDLPFEQAGHVPGPRDNAAESKYRWYPGDNLGLSIGQSYLSVTPLQMLTLAAAIANGGELITPLAVRQVLQDEAATLAVSRTELPRRPSRTLAVSAATLEIIREGMRQTVASPQGTGYASVNTPRIAIAGKTGSAQTGIDRPAHAWFLGYAPAESPRVAFVVLLEHGGSGGDAAGPIAREMVEKMLDLELLSDR